MWHNDVASLLGEAGPIAQSIPGFHLREAQQAMAVAVDDVIRGQGRLVCEAGTGTGKTLAYLVPACLSDGPVIISTGTRTLQEQLHGRDLPLVCEALGRPRRLAMLKGRANYLCRYRLQLSQHSGRLPFVQQAQLMRVVAWAGHTRAGDIEEVDDIPGDAPLWPLVTSTADNCLGQECPEYERCHVIEARRRAQTADIIVINHHLLFADMRLRAEGHGELLPDGVAIIVDEAHQLPELASQYFGESISAHRLRVLARDCERCQANEAPDAQVVGDLADALLESVDALRRELPAGSIRAAAWSQRERPATTQAIDRLGACLHGLEQGLGAIAGRGKGLTNCHQRCQELAAMLHRIVGDKAMETGFVHWFETSAQGFRFHRTPLDSADTFQAQMAHYGQLAWVFTSATLAVGGDFGHFARRLGLSNYESACWPSPFAYEHQALLYLPEGLPEPSEPDYVDRVVECSIPVLEASGGRAFFLFTSHLSLRRAAHSLHQAGLPYPLLTQGEQPRSRLLERFRSLGNAILLGTASFWEGIDVRGEALSCVIIDKLPFASPDDPVLRARSSQLRSEGGNPFRELQLPQAIIALKQGAGRLIRDERDRGVLVICDPRLRSRNYGKAFLENLPPMPTTHELAEVEAFLDMTAGHAVAQDACP